MQLDELTKSLGLTEQLKGRDDEEQDQPGEEEGSEESAEEEEAEAADESAAAVRDEPADDQEVERAGDAGDAASESDQEPAADEEPEAEGDEDSNELKRQNAGLRKELAKMREQQRLSRFAPQQQQPQAPQAQRTTAAPSLVEVKVSDDGSTVYVDPASLDALVTRRAQEVARQAAAPTPEQIINHQVQEATQEFIADDPRHKQIVDRVREADEYLSYHVAQLAQEGYRITNVPDAIEMLKARGIDQKVLAAYPELASVGFDDFFEQLSAGTKSSRRMLLKSIAAAVPAPKVRPKRQANGAKRPLGDQPRALARKGGGKATTATSDEREYKELEAEFNANVLNPKAFPDSKYRRMVALGRKIGIEGYDT